MYFVMSHMYLIKDLLPPETSSRIGCFDVTARMSTAGMFSSPTKKMITFFRVYRCVDKLANFNVSYDCYGQTFSKKGRQSAETCINICHVLRSWNLFEDAGGSHQSRMTFLG